MRASECFIRITSVASEREQRFSLTLADHIHMNPFLDLGTGAREELLVVAKRASVIKGGKRGKAKKWHGGKRALWMRENDEERTWVKQAFPYGRREDSA